MSKKIDVAKPASSPVWEVLEAHMREHAQVLLQELLEHEVEVRLGRAHAERRIPGAPTVYRNGYGKPRRLATTIGTLTIRRPRVRGLEEQFESQVLPLFKRYTDSVKKVLPDLYLHGLALGDFELALRGLFGGAAPLSESSIMRLKAEWEHQFQTWSQRSLDELDIVYCWADGLYVKAGLEKGKAALLVIIGATTKGEKVLLAVASGQRESTESWAAVLRDLRARGLRPFRLLSADGHLGIWSALAQIYPESAEQRCWNHKIMNVLDQVPIKQRQPVKQALRRMMNAPTRAECKRLRDQCIKQYRRWYPKAMEILERDWERMVTYYDFPAEHWIHLRTTNIVESPFASVRLRTNAGKRYKRVENATALIWKLLTVAEKTFRKLRAAHLFAAVAVGAKYVDGKPVRTLLDKAAA